MKCSFCNQKSVYHRKNEGHYYCKEHFTRSIEKRVRKTIRENKLLEKKERIAVALSGGKDSSVTLYLLKKILGRNPNIEILGITIDQGFKHVTDNDIPFAIRLCKNLEIEHHIFFLKKELGEDINSILKKNPLSSYCAICGVLRRYLINKKTRELKCTKLATGHNLDDECQNILMNILKGDMMRLVRVGAMPMITKNPKFVVRIKPLINIPEKEVRLFAKINKIKYSDKECPYRKFNNFRGETIKFLQNLEKNSPGINHSLLESVLKLKPYVEKKFKTDKIRFCEKCQEPASRKICKTCEVLGGVLC
jgi:uncharacterized protein (TIGR00269 family)